MVIHTYSASINLNPVLVLWHWVKLITFAFFLKKKVSKLIKHNCEAWLLYILHVDDYSLLYICWITICD